MGNAIYKKDGDSFSRIRNIRHKDTSFLRDKGIYYNAGQGGLLSLGYREHSRYSGDASISFTNSSGKLAMVNNGKMGTGMLWVVLDKQYVIDNHVMLRAGIQSNLNKSYTNLGIYAVDGNYDYSSLADFPDHGAMVIPDSAIRLTLGIATNMTTRYVWDIDFEIGNRYKDGVSGGNNYYDYLYQDKTIADFSTNFVSGGFAFDTSRDGYGCIWYFDNVKLINRVTSETLFELDASTISAEQTGTTNDYGTFEYSPSQGWKRINL